METSGNGNDVEQTVAMDTTAEAAAAPPSPTQNTQTATTTTKKKRKRKKAAVNPIESHIPGDGVSSAPDQDGRTKEEEEEEKLLKKTYRFCGLYHNCQVVGGKKRKCSEPTPSDSNNTAKKLKRPSGGGDDRLFPTPFARGEVWMLKESDFRLPYDIWWLQEHKKLRPKPVVATKFKKIRTNDYSSLTGVTNTTKDTPVCSCLLPSDASEAACGEDCLNRMVFTECVASLCPCGSRCSNQRFQKRQWSSNVERFLTNRCGFGLRATASIKKDQFIMEYVGEVISETEFRRRQLTSYHELDNHYCLSLHGGLVIDSTACGSEARFVNHCCSPNCEMQCWSVCGQYRMGLFALADLEPGVELTYDYRFDSLDNEAQICRCGSEQCRGFLCPPRLAEELQTLRDSKQTKRRRRKSKKVSWDVAKPVELFSRTETLKILSKREESFCVRNGVFLVRNAMRSDLWKILIENLQSQKTATTTPSLPTTQQRQQGNQKSAFRSALLSLIAGRYVRSRHCRNGESDDSYLRRLHIAKPCLEVLNLLSAEVEQSSRRKHIDSLRLPSHRKCPTYLRQFGEEALDFSIITQRVNKGHYTSIAAFQHDVKLVFDNTKAFYPADSTFFTSATVLEGLFARLQPQLKQAEARIRKIGAMECPSDMFGGTSRTTENGCHIITNSATTTPGRAMIGGNQDNTLFTYHTDSYLPGDYGKMFAVSCQERSAITAGVIPTANDNSSEQSWADCNGHRSNDHVAMTTLTEDQGNDIIHESDDVVVMTSYPMLNCGNRPETPPLGSGLSSHCSNGEDPADCKHGDEQEDQSINCRCGVQCEDGPMVLCEQCQSWQHCHCMGWNDDNQGSYLCGLCQPRPLSKDIVLDIQPTLCLKNLTYHRCVTDETGFSVWLGCSVYISRTSLAKKKISRSSFSRSQLCKTTDIFHVCQIWRDSDEGGMAFVFGYYYLHPSETYPTSSRCFYGNELIFSAHPTTVPLTDVVRHCVVVETDLHTKGVPVGFDQADIYISDFCCDRKKTHFSRISSLAVRKYHFEPTKWNFRYRDSPIEMRRSFRLSKTAELIPIDDCKPTVPSEYAKASSAEKVVNGKTTCQTESSAATIEESSVREDEQSTQAASDVVRHKQVDAGQERREKALKRDRLNSLMAKVARMANVSLEDDSEMELLSITPAASHGRRRKRPQRLSEDFFY